MTGVQIPKLPDDAEPELHHLAYMFCEDASTLIEKGKTYGKSWKQRGGVGAFMMLARKWDRIEKISEYLPGETKYDIFKRLLADDENGSSGNDGTLLAEIRDLRRYLFLVEGWLIAQKSVATPRLERNTGSLVNPQWSDAPAVRCSYCGAYFHDTNVVPDHDHPDGSSAFCPGSPIVAESKYTCMQCHKPAPNRGKCPHCGNQS